MTTALRHDLVSPRIEERLRSGDLTSTQVEAFREFLDRVNRDLLHHRIITDNAYTRRFRDGRASDVQLVHFVRQFSREASPGKALFRFTTPGGHGLVACQHRRAGSVSHSEIDHT